MDGVFINLTDEDVNLNGKIIPANVDLVTPIRSPILKSNIVNGIISTPLNETDIHYLQGTHWINTVYNKITRSEEEIRLTASIVSPYIKYPFTKEQIDKINCISNGRTRLFILTKKDAIFWSDGKFECPFRNYRLFSYEDGNLVEYQIPKTYLDSIVEGVRAVAHKII